MTPINQTKFREDGEKGNSLACCVASIWDLDLDDVPEFEEMPQTWRPAMQEFVAQLGYNIKQEIAEFVADDYYIVMGRTSSGHGHARVAFQGKVVHDPGAGRSGEVSSEFVIYFPDL
jgi:hypothetical protein